MTAPKKTTAKIGQELERSEFYYLGAAIAEAIFAPDRYEGRWYVRLDEQRRRRLCRNHATAEAWAKYLHRQGYRFISLQKEPTP